MFAMHHAGRVSSTIVLRKLSYESTKVAAKATRATAMDDRDVFGTLSQSGRKQLDVRYAEKNLPDDSFGHDTLEFDIEARKNAYYYKYEISKYARQGAPGLRKALELYQEMKAKARLTPTMNNFSPLLYGCAKAGYTKRAFDLYEESLRYLAKPSNSMITCLINSCAESPFPEYGIERLKWFLTHLKVNYCRRLNDAQYNCAIKAYGKLGQLEEASKLVQEMLNEDITPNIHTFNMLLMGCASNRDAGCSIALRVFKRMKMFQIQPTADTYKILLRCIRDCGMGSPALIEETLKELPAVTSHDQRLKYQSQMPTKRYSRSSKSDTRFTWMPLMSDIGKSIKQAIEEPKSSHDKNSLVRVDKTKKEKSEAPVATSNNSRKNQAHRNDLNQPTTFSSDDYPLSQLSIGTGANTIELPNLLSDDHLNLVLRIRAIKFDALKTGKDRLQLFGGFYGYLEAMMNDNCKPDIKTFSLILECLEGTAENYSAYHKLAGDMKLQRDLLFYDLLIRHICSNGVSINRMELALDFVEKMHLDNLRPNISTFESLAVGCSSWTLARRLLDDINKCGFIPSQVLIFNLIETACHRMNFPYLSQMIDYCAATKFQPKRRLVDNLEDLRLKAGKLILDQEKNPSDETKKVFDQQAVRSYDIFRYKLKRWLKKVDLKDEEHPWSQFKVDTSSKRDGFREYEKHFNAMEKVKREAFQSGQSLGNVTEKAKRLVESQV